MYHCEQQLDIYVTDEHHFRATTKSWFRLQMMLTSLLSSLPASCRNLRRIFTCLCYRLHRWSLFLHRTTDDVFQGRYLLSLELLARGQCSKW
jgi:hypothetical protein